jgi:hypothetical protein
MFREPEDGKLTLVGANEYRKSVTLRYRITDLAENTIFSEATTTLNANGVEELCKIAVPTDEKLHFYVMEWTADGIEGKNYYVLGGVPYSFDDYYRYMNESGMWEADGF